MNLEGVRDEYEQKKLCACGVLKGLIKILYF